MKESLGRFDLLNRETGVYESAELFQNVGESDIGDVERLWRPLLEQRSAEFESWSAAAEGNAQDAHWDWLHLARAAAASMSLELFAVECAGQTQGLMLVATNQFARLEIQRGRELVYVAFAATAPWNRRRFVPSPRYKGVGRLLMMTAISYSIEQGFSGRIALHSLPESESWYRRSFPFTDLGYDAEKQMHYFEMTEAQAAAVVTEAMRTE